MKDMLQNHLMEVLSLVAMEQPARLDADSFRAVRVEALRAVATPARERMLRATVRARYTAGTIGARKVPSYVDEPGVDPSRDTETYAALTLDLNTPRWSGVPFTIRSGKALGQPSAEIAVHFRQLRRSDRAVARCRAERPAHRPDRALRPAPDDPQRAPAHRPEARARDGLDAAVDDGIRPPHPGDAAQRPDAVHPRRRGRGGLADRRPRHAGPVLGRRGAPGVPRRRHGTRSARGSRSRDAPAQMPDGTSLWTIAPASTGAGSASAKTHPPKREPGAQT